MCPRGDVCELCSQPAIVEIHWPSWVMKLCDLHGSEYYNSEARPTLIFILGETNATTSVN